MYLSTIRLELHEGRPLEILLTTCNHRGEEPQQSVGIDRVVDNTCARSLSRKQKHHRKQENNQSYIKYKNVGYNFYIFFHKI